MQARSDVCERSVVGPLDVCGDRIYFFFQAEDGIRDVAVTGVQTCALPISLQPSSSPPLQRAESIVLLPFENRHWPASSRKHACPAMSLDTVSTWTEEAATTTQTTFLPGLSGSLEFLSGRWADRSQPKSYGFAKKPALFPASSLKHWSRPEGFSQRSSGIRRVIALSLAYWPAAGPASPNSALDALRNVKTNGQLKLRRLPEEAGGAHAAPCSPPGGGQSCGGGGR